MLLIVRDTLSVCCSFKTCELLVLNELMVFYRIVAAVVGGTADIGNEVDRVDSGGGEI